MTSREAVKRGLIACTILLIGVGIPAGADAYVGPGAGIAFMTTALALFSTIFVVLFGSILWPIRWVYLLLTQKRPPKAPEISRAVVIGLDGIDPNIVRTLMDEGALPNMAKLAERGDFRELETTYPAMSPVAWSSFSTGVNPAKHGIYDFMTRDPRNYAPDLSSAEVRGPAKFLKIGKWQVPLGKPQVRLLKRSRPFWKILSTYRIPSSILRVPVTFPPDRFDGTMLSAMCVPDLQGSQGTFTHLVGEKKVEHADTPDDEDKLDAADDPYAVGTTRRVELNADGVLHTTLQGPPNPLRHDGHMLELPLSMKLDEGTGSVLVRVGNEQVELKPGVYSEWIELKFAMAPGFKMRGICRMRVLELDPMRLYISPINIDPANPVLPISHPKFFAVFLAKLIGRFTTLGLAEDTWALNEGVLDDEAFLEQAWLNHAEREAMLFQMLKRTPKGLVACVFDATDRIQHMFYRYRHDDHPALRDVPESERARYRRTIEDTYIRYDEMLGRVFEEVDPNDPKNLLVVMSDHGFANFDRGVNLNTWLFQHGYLKLKEGYTDTSGEWFRGVDWGRTRAFALGLGGIFLNIAGREAEGIVAPEDADALAREIAEKLQGMEDPGRGEVAIQNIYSASDIYEGPYMDDAPHLVIGYARGWRASWDGARGRVSEAVFEDNAKAWSGDHCIDPKEVPGVLMTSRPLAIAAQDRASIMDVAPTILELFGVGTPKHMDGSSLMVERPVQSPHPTEGHASRTPTPVQEAS